MSPAAITWSMPRRYAASATRHGSCSILTARAWPTNRQVTCARAVMPASWSAGSAPGHGACSRHCSAVSAATPVRPPSRIEPTGRLPKPDVAIT
jgi:hypothetical protein